MFPIRARLNFNQLLKIHTMKTKCQLFLLMMMGTFVACSPSINYLGKVYEPTTQIEVFYDKQDISTAYEVMGIMKNTGSEFESDNLESIQKEMVKIARKKGADAVLIESAYIEKENTEFTDVLYEGSSISSKTTSKVLEGKLIKYKTEKIIAKDKRS